MFGTTVVGLTAEASEAEIGEQERCHKVLNELRYAKATEQSGPSRCCC